MKLISQAFKIVFTATAIILLTAGGAIGYVIRSPMPQVAGSIRAQGLQNEVTILRDDWGVPHIYADSTHDLLFAQGYVHAQDRFWQMEFWRRIGSGRLSEYFGEATLQTDLFIRTLGWGRAAAFDESILDNDTRLLLQWYADGVNAYLDSRSDYGLEFTLLGLQGVNVKPEKWTVQNSLTWLKVMAWDLSGNMGGELRRVAIFQVAGPEGINDLRPLYPPEHPVIVPNPAFGADVSGLLANVDNLNALTGGGARGLGSNNWVISGRLTDTGKPYLANDPHLGIQMPSVWYEVGLHCRRIADYCPFDVTGFSFAGVPGVVIGHNQRIAWGFTNLGPDVQDLYLERINPENPLQYEVNGQWADMTTATEIIVVKGRVEDTQLDFPSVASVRYDEGSQLTTITLKVRLTRHGPIIDDVSESARELAGSFNGIDIPEPSGFALKWTAISEPSLTVRAIVALNKAGDWEAFRNALREFSVPAQNAIYADVDGNIGYQAPGLIPIRRAHDGLMPVPGWTDEYEWQGYIPFEALPSSYNPPQGYIATANNAVAGPDYPYQIALDWDRGYRAERIVQMLNARSSYTLDDVKAIQFDNANLSAQEIVPYLEALTFEDPTLENAKRMLTGWDYQQHIDSAPAALYGLFWARLVQNIYYDELADFPRLQPANSDVTMLAVAYLLEQPDRHWWDNIHTADRRETRDDILRESLAEAYADGRAWLGPDPARWAWGQLHTATFKNATLGESGIRVLEAIFNRGPVPTGGGEAIVNATGFDFYFNEDGSLQGESFRVNWLPSMRMIVDLADFNNSRSIHTTGQSGHPFNAHYDDMIDPWRTGEYHFMLWDRSAVEAAARAVLTLTP